MSSQSAQLHLLSVILLYIFAFTQAVDIGVFKEKIISAKNKTNEILTTIFEKWQIKDYPNFLGSVGMTHTAWEVLKVSSQ